MKKTPLAVTATPALTALPSGSFAEDCSLTIRKDIGTDADSTSFLGKTLGLLALNQVF